MCKRELRDSEFTLHHIIPRAKGGETELYNLIGLCVKCHDIVELKELNREDIINYLQKYSLNDYDEYIRPIKKSYFMPEVDNQMEYKYPKEIILHEKYNFQATCPKCGSKDIYMAKLRINELHCHKCSYIGKKEEFFYQKYGLIWGNRI